MDEAAEIKLIGDVAETKGLVEKVVIVKLDALNSSVAKIKSSQHKQEGAIGALRWVVVTILAVGGIMGGYIFTQSEDTRPIEITFSEMIEQPKGGE